MKKIQIIEDDAALRRELRILLEGEGYAVAETEDYEDLAAEIMKETGVQPIRLWSRTMI